MLRRLALVIAASAATWMVGQSAASPAPQSSAILAYDESLRQVVLVSSTATPDGPADVWTWDGRAWARLDERGPRARSLAAGAYDSKRRELVVYGGRVGAEGFTSGDVWLRSRGAWRQTTPSGHGVRNHHAMAYDERRARTVMFGGVVTPPNLTARQQLAQRDTWTYPTQTQEWDGERWHRTPGEDPGARSGTALAYDGRHVILFGGVGPDRAYPAGTWAWNGASWRQVTTDGPPLRASHAMARDADRGVVFMYGGGYSDGTRTERFADMWQWHGTRWTQVAMQGPTPGIRIGHAMAYDRSRKRLVLFGGFGAEGTPMGDTWEWDGEAWSQAAR